MITGSLNCLARSERVTECVYLDEGRARHVKGERKRETTTNYEISNDLDEHSTSINIQTNERYHGAAAFQPSPLVPAIATSHRGSSILAES